MKTHLTRRLMWLLWLASLAAFVAMALFPLSDGFTRASGIALLLIVWGGLISLLWRALYLRLGAMTITLLGGVFLLCPARIHEDATMLRHDYVAGLLRYEREIGR